MRVMLISGHFSPDIGYQEVHLARAFARAGHTVKVLTTTYIPPKFQGVCSRSYQTGITYAEGYEIERVPVQFQWKTVLIPKGAKQSIVQFQPDIIIAIAIAKYMPLVGLDVRQQTGSKYIAIFGDRFKDRVWTGGGLAERVDLWMRQVAFLYKRRWYDRALQEADRIVCTVQETFDFLRENTSVAKLPAVQAKMYFIPLGFDENIFYFDKQARAAIRNQYQIKPEEWVVLTATKLEPFKRIDLLVKQIQQVVAEGLPVRFFLIGFGNDAYSEQIRQQIMASGLDKQISCLPFMTHGELRQFYSAADLGYWPREAISIQEAMGTGLPVLLKRDKIVSHLLDEQVNGVFIDSQDDVPKGIQLAYSLFPQAEDGLRERLMAHNKRYSYRVLGQQLLDTLL